MWWWDEARWQVVEADRDEQLGCESGACQPIPRPPVLGCTASAGGRIELVTAKELLLKRAPTLSEEEAARALEALDAEAPSRSEDELGEPEMVALPAEWARLPSGAPAPNWVARLDKRPRRT